MHDCREYVEYHEEHWTETHGLECGPYEHWTEIWWQCTRCGDRFTEGELERWQ